MKKENKDIVTLEFDEHGVNHEIGDTYLGEVNENGEPNLGFLRVYIHQKKQL